MEKYALLFIVALCIAIFIISVCRKKMELFITFVLRLFTGAVGIYVVNSMLQFIKMDCQVGLNGVNLLTVGVLGLPGFVMIYGIGLYFMMRG